MRSVFSFSVALLFVFVTAPALGHLYQASLKNGDYGGGAAIAPTSGVVNTPEGVKFVSTESSGRSNALINWQLATADRTPFRTAGTVSFCFRADRATFVGGSILGDNYGFGQFNNGQGSFGAFATRIANGPGTADDQVALTWQTWHNNVWTQHPGAVIEFDRAYRVGFAWGATSTRFEAWVNGTRFGAENTATLPWGAAQLGTGSATNFGLGSNHERGISAYGSVAGVLLSNIRISLGHDPTADTMDGCTSISIAAPESALTNRPVTVEATATGCAASATGWTWTASGNATISGGTTRSTTISWPSAGSFTVTAANTDCGNLSASKTIRILAALANVVVASLPETLVQDANTGVDTTTFRVLNDGDSATSVTLTRQGDFFTVEPMTFPLPARAAQVVTVTGLARAANAYRGAVTLSGAGVASGLGVPIVLLSASPPSAPAVVRSSTNRVDVSGGASSSPGGTVVFTNSGTGTLTGVLASTVPWLLPQSGQIVIPPGGNATVQFEIQRSKRPDSNAPSGSLSGDLQLVFRKPAAASGKGPVTHDDSSVTVSKVTVVDTVTPPVAIGSVPVLSPGEIALFVPGVGHVFGSVGLFVSDLSIINRSGLGTVADARLYYSPIGGGTSQVANLGSLDADELYALSDLVKTVFDEEAQIGVIQVRTPDVTKLSVGANVFNVSNPAGTYGTTIPVFRSDRAVAPGGKLYLTGLRSDSSGHTNIYLQEAAGLNVTVRTEFFGAAGNSVSSRTDSLNPFALLQLGRVVPAGAVAAVLTNDGASAGRLLAYATPVDGVSGDTWAVADWRLVEGSDGTQPVIIPVAGALHGTNNTYFRTDLAVMNTTTSNAVGTLRYYNRNGEITDKQLNFDPQQSHILPDVVTSFFNVPTDSAGHLLFTPSSGNFVVTSRTYTTIINDVATYGTGVPTRSLSSSLRPGDVRRIGGIEDAALSTINTSSPGTFRTNFVLVETAGQAATIRVTVRFEVPLGKVTTNYGGSRDYAVGPRQFLLLGGVTRDVLGAVRETFGDLRNVQVEFAHIGGNGAVDVLLSSVDNGTGDSLVRVE